MIAGQRRRGWYRRVRYVGEWMPLEDYYPYSVVFVLAPRKGDDQSEQMLPIGTGFLVSCADPDDGSIRFQYVVTASHVVANGSPTSVRVKSGTDGFLDLPVADWVHHPEADVALAPFKGLGLKFSVSVETELFVGSDDTEAWEPELGERVYFLGLFDKFRAMGERNIPMVRSGCVGALFVTDVPIGPPENRRHVTAHLIDCRSYAGFSGSPCFVQRDTLRPEVLARKTTELPQRDTMLLGIVSGHFDMWGAARLTGDIPLEPGSVEVPVNSGVGVVTPAQAIKELMDMDEVRADRERVSRERKERAAKDEGATLDTGDDSEFERFENLTRKLVNTPKPDAADKPKNESS